MMFRAQNMFSPLPLFALSSMLMTLVAGLSAARRDSGTNVAVCTLPDKISTAAVSNLARGITFSRCSNASPPPPAGVKYALVSISPESGFQQQFWDIGGDHFDPYWLRQYLEPQLNGFHTECWEAPEKGCSRPGLQPHAPKQKPATATRTLQKGAKADQQDTSDAGLLPLWR
ncbi:uncharacterized protein UMAG_00795 [Mycosarcoma maydis]|uniref:Mig1 protein n=1 Tax=Mycosarcoma maydis TaxID=5270 RepID=A0A0D1CHF8_MYCMD|nr:uncharacterized protein UMAG_00795 [Ustilago maydis 521]KIS72392.1 hypothetical protein UMAG_00795 [Ustilago maydis 521]|eukprot:XP_011386567.1 hypothetical protein UMAG_00795 [Ustilago maydis 521]